MTIKILVVDDSASDRFIIENMLSDYGIVTACDGVEAMQMLKEHRDINLIILDLNMPNMNGFQVLEALYEDDEFRGIRTIILTNYDELDNEIRGLRLGAVDYIRKPIHMASLRARIEVHASLLRAKKALEQRLDDQTMTFEMIFEQAPIGIAISHNRDPECPDTITMQVNPVYERITGRTKDELACSGWASITHPDDLEEELKYYRKLQAGEIDKYSMEKRFIKPDGSVAWVYMVVASLNSNDESKYNHICILKDITERKQIELERKYISEHNSQTGLYNRYSLEMRLAEDYKQKLTTKRALLGIDLSNTQLLTTNYGFMYTQKAIKEIADTLNQYSTKNRVLYQTHESRFVFYMLDYNDKKDLIYFGNLISDVLETKFVMDRINGGIGIVEIEQDQYDVDILLRRLLIASERSKSLYGKTFEICIYDDKLEALVSRERDIMQALSAIANDKDTNDRLYLQFQPILDLKTNRISGFEALARLNTEKLGPISPVEFIPIAEKSKLIVSIGEKINKMAFDFINRLGQEGYDSIGVSINISAIQLLSPSFSDKLFKLIDESKVNIKNVGIEITESVFASDYRHANRVLDRLRKAGIQIAIDDFGTGYSSLANEYELRVSYLKIDKYFIDKLLVTQPNKAITNEIISIAHKLGHYTIAEGVEYQSQLHYLENHNCDKVQGYLISRPLDEDQAIDFLKRYKS